MNMQKYFEVRCCCNPEILYGWLPATAVPLITTNGVGASEYVPMMQSNPHNLEMGTRAFRNRHIRGTQESGQILLKAEVVNFNEINMRRANGLTRSTYIALRYEDDALPIERKYENLRRVRGFIPNPTCL